jgi:predicted RNA-binding Zn-ribbon protein involved in translation (DUF1610 family)
MKAKQKCGNCGTEFFSSMIKVYVFKKRYCTEDKEPMLISPDLETLTCPKCGKVIKNRTEDYVKLGVSIEGTSRNFLEAEKRKADGKTEVEKLMMPEEQFCQRCRNFAQRFSDLRKVREMREKRGDAPVRPLPKEISNADIYKREIFQKLRGEYQTKMQEEAKQKEVEQKKHETEEKAKLLQDMTHKITEEKKEGQ